MSWRAFVYSNSTYDLSHLEAHEVIYVQGASGDKPARTYRVRVRYTDHCFTRAYEPNDEADLVFRSPNQHDPRTFDFKRYELSKLLPEIVHTLVNRKIRHGVNNNFLTIEVIAQTGEVLEYEVYFSVYKDKLGLNLLVQTAFPRDPANLQYRPKDRRIAFVVILFNTLTGKRIQIQQ